MKNKYRLILQGGTVLLFCLIFAAVIMYAKGYYDFTFVRRPEVFEEETEAETGQKHNPDNHSGEVNDQYIKNNVSEGDEAHSTYAEVIGKIPILSEMKEKKYKKTDESFDKDFYILARLEIPDITTEFSHSQEFVEIPEKVYDKYGGYTTVMQTVERQKPAIKLYDGMILYDDSETGHTLCDSDFNEMINGFDPKVYIPANKFTYGNLLPLFKFDNSLFYLTKKEMTEEEIKEEESKKKETEKKETEKKESGNAEETEKSTEKKRYKYILTEYTDSVDLSMQPSADIPSRYFYSISSDYEPFYNKDLNLWGYTDTINTSIEPKYFAAYRYSSNGLAAVVNQEGKYVFIDYSGNVVIDYSGTLKYQNGKNSVYSLIPPDTYGIESLGMFTFDHGLTRVRYRLYDEKDGIKKTYEDLDILIDEKGQKFDLPVGYNLVSYSEGVSVLEKDGKYGLYDTKQRWLAKPVYDSVTPFIQGVSVIENKNGKFAMIDTRGNILLDFVFDYISMPSNGVIAAYEEENGWSVFQIMTMPFDVSQENTER